MYTYQHRASDFDSKSPGSLLFSLYPENLTRKKMKSDNFFSFGDSWTTTLNFTTPSLVTLTLFAKQISCKLFIFRHVFLNLTMGVLKHNLLLTFKISNSHMISCSLRIYSLNSFTYQVFVVLICLLKIVVK